MNRLETVSVPAALALLALLLVQGILFIREASQTSDEAVHLAAGYAYLTTRDFRINPEHPPLIKMWAALPLLALDLSFPRDLLGDSPDQLEIGRIFVHENRASNNTLLFLARLQILALSLLLGWILFRWTRELFGPGGALLALALYVLDPNVVAHSSLVTTDLGLTLFLFVALYLLWRWSRRPAPSLLVLAGLALGGAFTAKFTALWLVPILAALGFLLLEIGHPIPAKPWSSASRVLSGPGANGRRTIALLSAGAMLASCAGVVIVACYVGLGLPWFFTGIGNVLGHARQGHVAYLMGEFSNSGWWYYFLFAFLVKTPIGTLIVLGLSVAALSRGARLTFTDEMFLWVPIAVIILITSMASVQIGLRHFLPAFPFLFLTAGRLASPTAGTCWDLEVLRPWVARRAVRAAPAMVVIACLAWNALEAASIAPHHLAYFNAFAGGPQNGHEYLLDSNLDWGQASKTLKRFVDAQGGPAVYCAYTSNQDPWYYGLRYQYVPGIENLDSVAHRPDIVPDDARRALLAVSVTALHLPYDQGWKPFDWLIGRRPLAMPGYAFVVFDITGDAESHARLASIYLRTQRPEMAGREARRALRLEPRNMRARSVLERLGAGS